MRHAALKVLILVCAFTVISVQKASASPQFTMNVTDDSFSYMPETVDAKNQQKVSQEKIKEVDEPTPEPTTVEAKESVVPVEYTVLPGDSLTKIATANQVNWVRIFYKNLQISDPDIISVGEKLTIPREDEELAERALPQPVVVQPQAAKSKVSTAGTVRKRSTSVSPASSSGNTYAAGYCTWYAKSRRPDLPNRLGNASSWVSRAATLGYATGTIPRAGAIGQQGNHVVYVERVNGDDTVTISEMNYSGLYVVSSRTASAGSFRYIY